MNFRSFADLIRITRDNAPRLDKDFDLIVGIPRSGMLPATVIALILNKPVIDFEGFLHGVSPGHGLTRQVDFPQSGKRRRVLFVEDSVRTGRNLNLVRSRLGERELGIDAKFLAIIADEESKALVDMHFNLCPWPRVFEWNLFNNPLCEKFHFDLDGIFCEDPSEIENDNGENYEMFLAGAAPRNLTKHRVRRVVTARLEQHRHKTEAWLQRHGVEYDELCMLDGVTAEERRQRKLHAPFKAKVYQQDADAMLFIESNSEQAKAIARMSGKVVLDFEKGELVRPPVLAPAYVRRRLSESPAIAIARIRRLPVRAANFLRSTFAREKT